MQISIIAVTYHLGTDDVSPLSVYDVPVARCGGLRLPPCSDFPLNYCACAPSKTLKKMHLFSYTVPTLTPHVSGGNI